MSEAARIRDSIDLAEFERRLRGAPAEEPQTAYRTAPQDAAPAAPAYPRAAAPQSAAAPAANPVASLREQLEAAAARQDPFQAVVSRHPNAADRFRAAPPQAAEPEQAQYAAAPAARFEAPYAEAPAAEPAWRAETVDSEARTGFFTRKRSLLLGGAAAVLVVGFGLTFAMRGGPSGSAPTIRASGEPYKIQPEAKPAGEKPSEAATILDRNGSERLAASRVVTREEQPVDVREAARQASAANTAKPGPTAGAAPPALPTAGPAANGFFPEPRRVRTVSVRPDGTIIEAPQAAPAAPVRAAPPPAPRQSAPAPAAAPAPAPQTAAPAPARAAAATPPKTSERAAPSTTAATAPAAPASATPAPAAPRAASPQSATVAATPRSGGGGFAVQLAAPGTESEAKAAISRIQQRYGSALGGKQPTVRKAKVGEKDVYRVRVVGLSQSDANGLCEKLKAAGGSCFVARE